MDDARAVLGSGEIALPASGRGPGALLLGGEGASADLLDEAARRLAHHGFVAWAPERPDAPGAGASGRETVSAAVDRLFCADAVQGPRVAALGFGAGGALALAAARVPRVAAAVCLEADGALAAVEGAGALARVCLISAEKDPAVAEGTLEALRAALAAEGARAELRVLPGVERGFLDPRQADRYDAAAARAAWDAALAVLRAEL